MVKSFYIGRMGNKTNDIKYFSDRLPMDCKRVIEPFGGSYAVTRNVYNDDKYEKHINDKDKTLYELYTKQEEYIGWTNEIIKSRSELMLDDTKLIDKKKFIKKVDEVFKNDRLKENYLNSTIVRGRCCKLNKSEYTKFDTTKYIFTCDDYLSVIEKYKRDKKAFIFLDPPYLFSDNSGYDPQKDETDMTAILVKLKEFMDDKKTLCKVMLVINDLEVIRYLFNRHKITTYDKIYQIGKKKSSHLVITNY